MSGANNNFQSLKRTKNAYNWAKYSISAQTLKRCNKPSFNFNPFQNLCSPYSHGSPKLQFRLSHFGVEPRIAIAMIWFREFVSIKAANNRSNRKKP